MQLGKLNRRVEIWRATETDGDSGGQALVWAKLSTIWVNAVPVGGNEALSAGMLQTGENWRITMRHRAVTTRDRIKMDDRALEIVSAADPDGRRDRIVCLCTLLTGAVDS